MRLQKVICVLALGAVLAGGSLPYCVAQEEAAAGSPAFSLKADPAREKEAAKRLQKLIHEHVEKGDYDGLRDSLESHLKEDFPKAFADDKAPLWKAPVKGAPARRALDVLACITLAQESVEVVDGEPAQDDGDFLKWLLTDAKAPASLFVQGLHKAKVANGADAASMMGDLRNAYADLGRKAVAEIKIITNPKGKGVSRKFYPMDRREQAKRIRDILAARPSHGADQEQQDAVNVVNLYRLLCGTPPNMSYDATYAKDAQEAAEACKQAGKIDHGLGHFTNETNLHMGTPDTTPADSVREYVADSIASIDDQRGHRAWVLYPKAVRTGFGKSGKFHAMRTCDLSGAGIGTPRSYPGRGFFPKEYLLGEYWSYYAAGANSIGEEATVRMWRLPRSPRSAPSTRDLEAAQEIKVKRVVPHPDTGGYPVDNTIDWMPDSTQMPTRDGKPVGVYWVSISSGRFHDEYVVELY